MVTPKLVLFDFGGTLFDDGPFIPEQGMEALRLAADNPEVTDATEMTRLFREFEGRLRGHTAGAPDYPVEVPIKAVMRNIFDRAGLKHSMDMTQCEVVFDRNNSTRQPTPHIADLLAALRDKGIRAAIISNISISGAAMRQAVDEHLPEHCMEFVITSADYLFCKPAPDMFLAAARRAGVDPGECWYCGDGFVPDVLGAHNSGIYPILFDRRQTEPFVTKFERGKEYAVINDWRELIRQVERG